MKENFISETMESSPYPMMSVYLKSTVIKALRHIKAGDARNFENMAPWSKGRERWISSDASKVGQARGTSII